MDIVARFIEAAKGRGQSVVLPEGHDERVLLAARRLTDEGIAEPIVLGEPARIEEAAAKADVSLRGLRVIEPRQSEMFERYAAGYIEGRDLDIRIARRMVRRRLFFGGMMVKAGDADAMVGGVASPTSVVIQAGVLTVGYAPGIKTASSFFLMILPEFQGARDRPFIFADCAVNIDPTAEQLADIALASEASARGLLDEEPRVALLSFSTQGSAAHAQVNKVTEALALIQRQAAGGKIDGEFQADAAIIPSVAAKKVKQPSAVVGQANVLVFPDLNSGNIAYKLTQYMAGAQAIGPFLQGFAKPISDLSRGASVDDIVATAAITLSQAESRRPRSGEALASRT